jgi:HEPN superfamily protein
MRSLYWLSKDIFEEEFHRLTKPDAQALKETRDHLEHKYLQTYEEWVHEVPRDRYVAMVPADSSP